MGDNRAVSKDSRSTEIEQIDCREIIGKAVFLFLPGADEFTGKRDFERIGGIS
jgi:signal peptidase I